MSTSALHRLQHTLVAFATVPAPGARVVWRAPGAPPDAELIDGYAYRVPHSSSTAPGKTFFADGYGGLGLFRNGGSARCGYDGTRLQVKGIGPTPYLGREVDLAHSNGMLSLQQALYEALWGTLLETFLPFGCVGTIAVLVLDERMPAPLYADGDSRALLIREAPVRPAHFDRALYFQPAEALEAQVPRDALRVRANIPQLHDFLPCPPGHTDAQWRALSTGDRRRAGLLELLRRIALQLAATRARSLKLMASPSNLDLQGRVLDFTSVVPLLPLAQRGDPAYVDHYRQMLGEHRSILESFDNIGYYLGKYTEDAPPQLRAELTAAFAQFYSVAASLSYPAALGIPPILLHGLAGHPALIALANASAQAQGDANCCLFDRTGSLPWLSRFYLHRGGYRGGDGLGLDHLSKADRQLVDRLDHVFDLLLAREPSPWLLLGMALAAWPLWREDDGLDADAVNGALATLIEPNAATAIEDYFAVQRQRASQRYGHASDSRVILSQDTRHRLWFDWRVGRLGLLDRAGETDFDSFADLARRHPERAGTLPEALVAMLTRWT